MESATKPRWIVVGEIVGTQGRNGEVKVVPHTDFPERFAEMAVVRLFRPKQEDSWRCLRVERYWFHKQFVILKLETVESIDDAQTLRGMEIRVSPDELFELPDGRFYVFDLIGLDVVTELGVVVGSIEEVLQTGANDVFVVRPRPGITKNREVLIPVIDEVVLDIVPNEGRVLVRLMDGLLE